jgi:hypothetical protein
MKEGNSWQKTEKDCWKMEGIGEMLSISPHKTEIILYQQ